MGDPSGQLAVTVAAAHTALVVVDVQTCFCDQADRELPAMLARLHRLISVARSRGVPVVFTQVVQTDATDTEVWLRLYERAPHFRELCRAGTEAADFHPDFRPQPGDIVVVKHRYSAFVGTSFEEMLHTRGVRALVLAGLTTDCCVGTTAHDAFQRDFHAVVVEDCTAAATAQVHEAALATHRDAFGLVVSAAEIEAVWTSV